MKALFTLVLVVSLELFHCSTEPPDTSVSVETIKQLSLAGEKFVGEEVRSALYGIKEMKETMAKNEEKHRHLMKALLHSGQKKQGAVQLAQEVEQKLSEAEGQCRDSLQSSWDECRPCLEDVCKTFYISTCRRGISSFTTKVESFFRRTSTRLGPGEAFNRPMLALAVHQSDEAPDQDAVRIEDSFNSLLAKVGGLCERANLLVSRTKSDLGRALRSAFVAGPGDRHFGGEEEEELSPDEDSGFLKGVGLEEVLDSFFDFGKSVAEEFGAVVTQIFDELHGKVDGGKQREREVFPRFMQNRRLCRDLRRQASECWQLQNQCEACKETQLTGCASATELHAELDEVSQLLEVSKQQYDEVLGIVQRHTDETVGWLSDMAAEFSWVADLANNGTMPESIFSIVKVHTPVEDRNNSKEAQTKVEVNILNSPPLTLIVPADLEVLDPAFIKYVAQKALGRYKQMASHDNSREEMH